jgi:hypothetical protein
MPGRTEVARVRRPVNCPAIGWVPRPLEDAAPGLVGLAFMAAGLLVWLLFWFGVDEPPRGLAKWGPVAFAALFFSAGVFLARMGFRAPRWWADRRFRGGREPWGQGYRWSRTSRPLPPQQGLGLVERALGLVVILALLVVSNLVWSDLRSVTGDAWVVFLVIPAVSIAMLATVVLGAWGIVVQLRERRGTLHLDADPNARTRMEFALPVDAPPTDLARAGGRRCWILQVAGRDAAEPRATEPETFLVPVY